MKKKRLPKKYRNEGLHIWCTKCKKVVTNHPCQHAENQRYQSRIYNPHTKRQDCIKTHKADTPKKAWDDHRQYRKQLEEKDFNIPSINPTEKPKIKFLREAAGLYMDYLKDINVPSYEHKNLTQQHINDTIRYLLRFLEVVQSIEGTVAKFPIATVGTKHVAGFDEMIIGLNLSDRSYNAHITAVKYFFEFLIKNEWVKMRNPFGQIPKKHLAYDPEIIPLEEFERFLAIITPVNGVGNKGSKKETVNFYRPWMKRVFVFSLLTGERLDGIVLLKWKDIKDNYIGIPNWKVNRIKKTSVYQSYTPITRDLAEVLTQFDISSDPDQYIVAPEYQNRDTLKKLISGAFSHYWKFTGINRKVTFKNLRKTYITRMTDLLGEKAMFIKHGSDRTAIKHYLNKKELISSTRNIELFNIKEWDI